MNITALLERYDLKPQHVYLLELVPLMEMVWIDGRNQKEEVKIIHEITQQHVAELNSLSEGIEIIPQDDVSEFLNRFLLSRPPEGLLKELRELIIDWWKEMGQVEKKSATIIDYCMDIAAACVTCYPYEFNERIVEQEKALIKELYQALVLDA